MPEGAAALRGCRCCPCGPRARLRGRRCPRRGVCTERVKIKACMGSVPCTGCQGHLAGGPYVGNGPDMQLGIPPAFSSDAALVWGQILYLPSQEFQNGSQGLLKIGGIPVGVPTKVSFAFEDFTMPYYD
ncbi:hypothetical protein MJG53_008814 [Ovis ammon polii x Ovis aries]|uniref:Uncharacterized protein n=1 Tax=Ovis ammon polii x Ovis aries TaxID=2918886 RepID=A0ACB9UXU7_9CETA|nr:hypothetical protein MJT46_008446 [Ovis ammon polii x Ovis aries]KAI4582263.1 hypothetical protein MJG53_008814 [Ovis ammon polii x Ovis aries]